MIKRAKPGASNALTAADLERAAAKLREASDSRALHAALAERVIAEVKFPKTVIHVVDSFSHKPGFLIYSLMEVTDSITGTPAQLYSAAGLPPSGTPEQIAACALMLLLQATEHEVREHFQWKGERVFNPHGPKLILPDFIPAPCDIPRFAMKVKKA